jgi:transitional endoplasmic reticulum ATPase
MGKDLSQAVPETHVAEIVHHGEKLILPEGMTIQKAIDLLFRRAEYLETDVAINEKFDVFPFDGAFGLSQVIIERYGWAQGVPIQQMFGSKKPEVYKVAISPTEKVDVPWGRFELPNIKGYLETGLDQQHGRAVFTLSAVVKRKYEPTIRGLFDELRAWLREHSLYRGKAIKIRFRDDDGEPVWMPEVTFMDVSESYPEKLLLNDDLSASLNANLFTPISRVDDCLQNGIKVKRGVLMAGKYGTGKTLAATVAAHLAEKHEVTYVYTPRAEELGDAIAFAKQYQSPACVVFCEDIDRTVQGERQHHHGVDDQPPGECEPGDAQARQAGRHHQHRAAERQDRRKAGPLVWHRRDGQACQAVRVGHAAEGSCGPGYLRRSHSALSGDHDHADRVA